MSGLLLWLGLTILVALTVFVGDSVVKQIGAVIMIAGWFVMLIEYISSKRA